MIAVMPTLRRILAPVGTEHPAPAQAELHGHVVNHRITGAHEARDQAGSSGSGASRSPGPKSPGRTRSSHGTHGGASNAVGPGTSTTSLMVAWSVPQQPPPRRPTASPGNRTGSPGTGGRRRSRRRN